MTKLNIINSSNESKVQDLILSNISIDEYIRNSVIQIIEDDFQLFMRMFLCLRVERDTEYDKISSNFNCGSRKGWTINSALIEKRFAFDFAQKTEKYIGRMTSDLKACYYV